MKLRNGKMLMQAKDISAEDFLWAIESTDGWFGIDDADMAGSYERDDAERAEEHINGREEREARRAQSKAKSPDVALRALLAIQRTQNVTVIEGLGRKMHPALFREVE